MAFSTMRTTVSEQTAAMFWTCSFSHVQSFQPSPAINYICVPTAEEVKQQIISALGSLKLQGRPTLAHFWAAKKVGNTFVLTMTGQPFGLLGINEDLVAYHKGCLDHKLYVYIHPKYPSKCVAFGLPGRVFLNRTPEQTGDVHACPPDQRPPCDDAIFTKKWASFALPVIVDDQCIGVLEFVTDTPSGSNQHDIDEVYRALEHVGLRSSNRIHGQGGSRIQRREIKRVTPSVYAAWYFCLSPHFGLSSVVARQKLGLKRSTFRNVCRDVGIPEWPRIRNTTASETSNNQTILDVISFETMVAGLFTSWEEEIPVWLCDQTTTTLATRINQEGNNDIIMEDPDDADFDMEQWINELYNDNI